MGNNIIVADSLIDNEEIMIKIYGSDWSKDISIFGSELEEGIFYFLNKKDIVRYINELHNSLHNGIILLDYYQNPEVMQVFCGQKQKKLTKS